MPKQILIVEDDVDLAKILQAILEKNGYKVRVALDGSEALDIIMKELIDCIVLDLKLTWVEGDIVIRLVKAYEKTKQIPIIVLTGLSPEEVAKYQLDGVATILHKPMESRVLLEKIKEAFLKQAAA